MKLIIQDDNGDRQTVVIEDLSKYDIHDYYDWEKLTKKLHESLGEYTESQTDADEDEDEDEPDFDDQWDEFIEEHREDADDLNRIRILFNNEEYGKAWEKATTLLDTLLRDEFPEDIWNKMYDEVEG